MSVVRNVTILFVLSMLTRVCFLTISKTVSVNTVRNITGMSKFDLPNRLKGNEKSVWVEYIQLALQYKPLNLGQGFPDYYAPENVTNALATVAKSDNPLLQQYTRGFGHPRLVNAIAKFYSKLINRDLDPNKEVLVTAGAYEALYSSLQGHTNLGDEWIVIEPFFDCYVPMIQTAGGIPRFIALKPKSTSGTVTSGDWVFDRKEMEGLFNEKTKGIVINTPHNPIGKIFTLDELQFIADLAKKWNVLVISDEVYEHIVYEPYKHIRMATLPGMYERTITIERLLHNLQVVHQNSVYTCTTPTQEAVAIGFELEMERLEQPDCYFRSLAMELLPKRDYMAKFLQEVGMVPTIPEGGYFMLANWSALENKVKLNEETDASKDYRFTKWMTKNVGLQGIPPTAFYGPEHKTLAEDYVRYCFIKKDENLKAAAKILKKWVSQ
ncbi:PREDICTED: LOW QUALITY PROTEIN: kynurenine--oxoglutarate transaminase 3 [Acromyrmex echinatior]|uniref:LOW QUALITY PROTEIN: kynurenine--oxoglutarate transaminase 3 n=1 Tax=Acromyrmex echinatior TaxID=103372 RepID=UPI000580FC59|nr:PREDICTED: LOW QUALITY PROTEIN: kynurenine--oxoglutarate transaminase 3 [Acromyrmex echinatior]